MAKLAISSMHTRYLTVKDWPKFHAWPTEAGLRNLIARRKTNGFEDVLVRVGGRILIDEQAFDIWLQKLRKENKKK